MEKENIFLRSCTLLGNTPSNSEVRATSTPYIFCHWIEGMKPGPAVMFCLDSFLSTSKASHWPSDPLAVGMRLPKEGGAPWSVVMPCTRVLQLWKCLSWWQMAASMGEHSWSAPLAFQMAGDTDQEHAREKYWVLSYTDLSLHWSGPMVAPAASQLCLFGRPWSKCPEMPWSHCKWPGMSHVRPIILKGEKK